MGSLIELFHIDFKLLIAQAINFLIVFLVLYFFALKPLFKIMQERTKKIEKSLTDAEKIEINLANTKKECDQQLSLAKKEASLILEKAGEAAEENKKKMIANGKEEIGQIIDIEKSKMMAEKAKILKEIKSETAAIAAQMAEKILAKTIDKKMDKKIIESAFKEIKSKL